MQSFIELSDVGKVRVASPDQRPPEQLEGGLVRVEELGPVVVINLVNIDNHQGEADVDDNEDKEEDEYINDHVGHGDDNRPRLSPHETSLNISFGEFQGSFTASSHLNIPEESHQSSDSPKTSSHESHFVPLIRTTSSTFILGKGKVPQYQGGQEYQVVHQDVNVLECQPSPQSFGSVLYSSLFIQSLNCSKVF